MRTYEEVISDIKVRTLCYKEPLPSWMNPNMLSLPDINHQWVWVAESPLGKEAVLVAGELHGIAVLWRLEASFGACDTAVLKLLREAIAQIKERGFTGFICFLSGTEAKELKLARIVQRVGGQLIPISGYWAAAKL